MDEIIIFACLILLIIYGFVIKLTNSSKRINHNDAIIKTRTLMKSYISSKILLIGETGLFSLLLCIIFNGLKPYLILVWAVISFIITIQSFSRVDRILNEKKLNKRNYLG